MKFKLMAAILGLMSLMAIPGVVLAQAQNDQMTEQDGKPSPNVPMPGPNDQGGMNQGSMNQGLADQGSSDQGSSDQGSSDQGSMNDGSMNQGPSDQGSTNQGPSDQNSMNQGATNRGSMDQGSGPADAGANGAGAGAPSSNAPAPQEKNGVARISLIHGDVSTQRGDTKDWAAAALNAPVVAGDSISTGDKARTELELDYANTLRLAEHTQANIVQLTRTQIQIQLGHGMANYTVFRNSDADAEIDTPNVAIKTERREASFRILVTADDHTEVLVRKGEIEVTTPQGGTRVGQNQFITIQGTGGDAQYKVGEAPARDDFDQWNTDRDTMIRNSEARRHTNDYYVGTENLDGHGTWSQVPDYGQVWRPAVPPDWAPYRNGRWVYEPYWGWTWVSYDDWGWAPYHYGRWMYVDGGWGWWPGPAYGYPIWAPAYVSFFGFGPGFGIGFGFGFGFGSIGWLPLGPGDFFHPWWGRWGGGYGFARGGEFNRGGFAPLRAGSRFSNVNLALHDGNFRGATSASGRDFGTGHMSAHAVGHAQLQNARFSTGRLGVNPSRESFSASGRAAAASTTRNVAQNQHFFSAAARGAAAQGSAARGTAARGTTTAAGGRSAESVREGAGARAGNFGSRIGSNGLSNSGFERSNQSAERSGDRSVQRGVSAGGRESASNGGWQKFSPMAPRSSAESARSESSRPGEAANRSPYGSSRGEADSGRGYGSQNHSPQNYGSQNHSPQNYGSQNYGSQNRGYGAGGYGSSRPPLNMRQPIVTQRSYGGGAYGGGRSAPSFGGGHSAPSSHGGGGSHGGGATHGGGSHGGGSHGGGSHGGGGRHGR